MSWKIEYLEEAAKDIRKLDGSIRKQYARAIEKVANNPLPANEGVTANPWAIKVNATFPGCSKSSCVLAVFELCTHLHAKTNAW